MFDRFYIHCDNVLSSRNSGGVFLKKIITYSISILSVFLLVACGKSSTKTSATQHEKIEKTATKLTVQVKDKKTNQLGNALIDIKTDPKAEVKVVNAKTKKSTTLTADSEGRLVYNVHLDQKTKSLDLVISAVATGHGSSSTAKVTIINASDAYQKQQDAEAETESSTEDDQSAVESSVDEQESVTESSSSQVTSDSTGSGSESVPVNSGASTTPNYVAPSGGNYYAGSHGSTTSGAGNTSSSSSVTTSSNSSTSTDNDAAGQTASANALDESIAE